MNQYVEYIGLLAGTCTTVSFIPQIIKIAQTKVVADISKLMYIIYITGLILWVSYGICCHSYSLVLANSLTLVLAICILIMKIMWDKK